MIQSRKKQPVVFALPGNEALTQRITQDLGAESGCVTYHKFPDSEVYVKVLSNVEGSDTILVCTLYECEKHLLSLLFLCNLLRDMKVKSICLVAPYLSYMRQDKQFNSGEAVTSRYFASLLSSHVDRLVTIDPHLHRYKSMQEIYSIPCSVIHASKKISDWIRKHIPDAVLIGPDSESLQWVSDIAKDAGRPFITLEKTRHGDRDVSISSEQLQQFRSYTPVLIDDIISTAHTMIEATRQLKQTGMKPPICIGIHAVFADNAYEELMGSGVKKVITCNTIMHKSNGIDIAGILTDELGQMS